MRERVIVHVRRCHICDHVNERDGQSVDRCGHCGKILAPYYFFDEQNVHVYSDVEQRPTLEQTRARPKEQPGEHRPLRGFSAVW